MTEQDQPRRMWAPKAATEFGRAAERKGYDDTRFRPPAPPPISQELAPASRSRAGGEPPLLQASRPENRNEHVGRLG